MISAMRLVVVRACADLEIGAERAGDLVAHEVLQRLTGHAAQHLADEMAVVEGVIARRRARLPPRRLGGECGRRLLPVENILDDDRLVPSGNTRRVRQQMTKLDVLLAVRGELGPVVGDRRAGFDQILGR